MINNESILANAPLMSDIKTEMYAVSSATLQADYLPQLIEELSEIPNRDKQENELLLLAKFMQRMQYQIAAMLTNSEIREQQKATSNPAA